MIEQLERLHSGPWRFRLMRGAELCADGVQFQDGSCVLRWRGESASHAVYTSFGAIEAVHLYNGRSIDWLDLVPHPDMGRGIRDAFQDHCEGCFLASVGGARDPRKWESPKYVKDVDAYRDGYLLQALRMGYRHVEA